MSRLIAGLLLLLGLWLPAPEATGAGKGEDEGLSVDALKAMSLEELSEIPVLIVSSASKREQRSSEAPASVSVVTREDIQHFGHRTLGDVLSSVRGFYVNNDRSYSFLGTRGAHFAGSYGGRTLVLVNGHRIADPIYDTAPIGYEFPVDVDLIERVEVVRGPGFSIYGNNAFFAVINVVTRTPASLDGGEVSGGLGSYDTFSGRLTYGRRFTNGLAVLLSGTLLDRAGHSELFYPEYRAENGGIARDLDHEKSRNAFMSLSYADFTLSGAWSERTKQVPTAQYGNVFNDPRYRLRDMRDYLEGRYQRAFGESWEVMGRLYLDRYRYGGVYPFPSSGPAPPNPVSFNIDDALAWWWGGEANVSKTLFNRNKILVGTEFNLGLEVQQKNYDMDPREVYVDRKTGFRNYGVYLQDEFTLSQTLLLNGSIRYDHFNTFGGAINFRGGAIYQPWTDTTLKLVYGQGYRAPNAYELYYVSSLSLSGTNVGPEHIRSHELVIEQRLSPNLSLSANLFYNVLDDLLAQHDFSGLVGFNNDQSANMKGVEAELEGRWRHSLRTRLAYTYASVTDGGTGAWLPNSPKHMVKANVSVPLYEEKLFAGLEIQARSRSLGFASKPGEGGFVTVNLNLLSRELIRGVEASAGIYNLLDTAYGVPVTDDFAQSSILQDGRSFRIKATIRF